MENIREREREELGDRNEKDGNKYMAWNFIICILRTI
jgi:hypothetical protein